MDVIFKVLGFEKFGVDSIIGWVGFCEGCLYSMLNIMVFMFFLCINLNIYFRE